MKKKFTFLSVLLLSASINYAQNKMVLESQNAKPVTINTNYQKSNGTAVVAKADGDILFQSDFAATGPQWTIGAEANGLQGTFVVGAYPAQLTTYAGAAPTTFAGNVASFNAVQYLLAGPVNNQNSWIASEVIDFSSTELISISFDQVYRAFNFDNTFIEFSADGGATWTSTEVNTDVAGNANAPLSLTLDMTIPAGVTNGKIRFRWESLSTSATGGSGYGWAIDNVVIREGYTNNVALSEVFSAVGAQELTYTIMPTVQAAAAGKVSFGAIVKNTGKDDQDITLNVTPQGASVLTSTAASLVSMDSDTLSILTANGYVIPTTIGTYNFNATLTTNTTLVETADDAKAMPFAISQDVFAVDGYDGTNASVTSSFTGWANAAEGDAQEIGTYFEVFADQTVYSVETYIGFIPTSSQASYVGVPVRAKIYDGETGDEIDGTEEKFGAVSMFNSKISLFFNDPIQLQAGKLYLVTVGGTGDILPVGMSGNVIAGTVAGVSGTSQVGLSSGGARSLLAPIVRLNFKNTVGVNDIEANYALNVFPNPFNASTDVAFELKNDTQVSISVSDVTGRVVKSIDAKNYAAGANKVTIDGADLNAGIYNVSIKLGNNVITKRIVKQ